jgi:hypothetical protein
MILLILVIESRSVATANSPLAVWTRSAPLPFLLYLSPDPSSHCLTVTWRPHFHAVAGGSDSHCPRPSPAPEAASPILSGSRDAEEGEAGAGVAQQPNLDGAPARAGPTGPLRRRPRPAAAPQAPSAGCHRPAHGAAAVLRAGSAGGRPAERRTGGGRRGGPAGAPARWPQDRGAWGFQFWLGILARVFVLCWLTTLLRCGLWLRVCSYRRRWWIWESSGGWPASACQMAVWVCDRSCGRSPLAISFPPLWIVWFVLCSVLGMELGVLHFPIGVLGFIVDSGSSLFIDLLWISCNSYLMRDHFALLKSPLFYRDWG